MRKLLLLYLLCHGWSSQAQARLNLPIDRSLPFSRHTWLAGFQMGYSKGTYSNERYSATHLYGSYFVVDKLAIGLAASRGQENLGAAQDVAISVGPMVRYQFTRTRLSPFLVGSYQFGQATVSGIRYKVSPSGTTTSADTQNRPIQSRYVGLGLSLRVIKACRLDLLLTWQDKPGATELGFNGQYNLLQTQLGVNYLLDRRR
ncbi:hypothetical protein EXU85_25990 [Spirosoma sp. KCTC 42546]|uniref:hypothetical protein n=1 Tax=Spirosoma sp. KCTC 42546 TaxID=2520506 RepID=UPI001157355B|nr:hypothetical protein [Spirosoma sp. KCTC 42546]QDK81873.1 hypothetical protein EXU85_25990 [Spirosoma sp. KCTC 42546]